MPRLTTSPSRSEQRATEKALLRQKAEEQVHDEENDFGPKSPDEVRRLVHDLQVHQVELEMQNDQLRLQQLELETARERYAQLYDFAPVGYLTVGTRGEILEANLTSVGLLGVERRKLVGENFSSFVVRMDQESYIKCLTRVFSSRMKQSCELRLQERGGGPFFARIEAVAVWEGTREVCLMTVSNITEHKRAEERLRVSESSRIRHEGEEWKRLALEAADFGAWDHDLRKADISCSGETRKILGIDHNASLTWDEIVTRVHPEDLEKFQREIERSTVPGGTQRVDVVFRIIRNGGEIGWVRLVAKTSFVIEAGCLRAARRTGVLADITTLKRAEETLRNHAEKLERTVRDRTARLEDAVTELEHLSYTLVHDLRAPLRAISGYTALVLDQNKSLNPAHKMFLERSNAAAARMDNLIVDALAYSEAGRHQFLLEPVDTMALLKQLIETYPQFNEERGQITIEKPLPAVMGNDALLTQCFSNLLTNALKFVAPGKQPVVRIFAEGKGKRVRLVVEDEGIGIEKEGHDKLFQMFQRLQKQYPGTGIGLALVKKAVERMNGKAGVESEPGKGSRFWLDLEKAEA